MSQRAHPSDVTDLDFLTAEFPLDVGQTFSLRFGDESDREYEEYRTDDAERPESAVRPEVRLHVDEGFRHDERARPVEAGSDRSGTSSDFS